MLKLSSVPVDYQDPYVRIRHLESDLENHRLIIAALVSKFGTPSEDGKTASVVIGNDELLKVQREALIYSRSILGREFTITGGKY